MPTNKHYIAAVPQAFRPRSQIQLTNCTVLDFVKENLWVIML